MSGIYISKIKARRGTNQQRLATILDQGELVYTTDTKRLYVGNGVLSGGNPVTYKIHNPLTSINSLSVLPAEVGDIISIDNIWWQLTANPYSSFNNWGKLATKISSEFEYNSTSTLNLKLSSVSPNKLNPSLVNGGLFVSNDNLKIRFNSKFFEISSNDFSLVSGGITEREINPTSFGNGISGGNGDKITIKINPQEFYFDGGFLRASYPSTISQTVSSLSGRSTFYTPRTIYNDLSALSSANVGDVTTVNGVLYQLQSTPSYVLGNWEDIGDRKALQRSVFSTLTCKPTTDLNGALSSIFSGTPAQTLSGAIPGLKLTTYETISSNGISNITVILSSAGFLSFEGGFASKTGQPVGRFAIPIFTY